MNEILGMGPKADSEEHTCENCGKEIKVGEHYTMDGKKYCCENCCKVNTPEMKKKAEVCEFC